MSWTQYNWCRWRRLKSFILTTYQMIADFVRGITWLLIGLCRNYLGVFCWNKGQRVLKKYFNVFNKTIKYLKCLFSCCVQDKKKQTVYFNYVTIQNIIVKWVFLFWLSLYPNYKITILCNEGVNICTLFRCSFCTLRSLKYA